MTSLVEALWWYSSQQIESRNIVTSEEVDENWPFQNERIDKVGNAVFIWAQYWWVFTCRLQSFVKSLVKNFIEHQIIESLVKDALLLRSSSWIFKHPKHYIDVLLLLVRKGRVSSVSWDSASSAETLFAGSAQDSLDGVRWLNGRVGIVGEAVTFGKFGKNGTISAASRNLAVSFSFLVVRPALTGIDLFSSLLRPSGTCKWTFFGEIRTILRMTLRRSDRIYCQHRFHI